MGRYIHKYFVDENHNMKKIKHLGKSDKYKHVYLLEIGGEMFYQARIGMFENIYKDEHEAAKNVDIYLLKKGRKTVNNTLKKI